jgi:hypothetical protein
LVLEQAPPDIDQYIQPSDSALLLSSLTSLSVTHFGVLPHPDTAAKPGSKSLPPADRESDPRSFSIRWSFAPNEYFEDEVLEKRFWHRRARDGWTGLVSEPVPIRWKKGKDLTAGMLDAVCRAWQAEKGSAENGAGKKDVSEESEALRKKMDKTGMGGLSFFAWFGFIGRRVSAEESVEATRKEDERREARRRGVKDAFVVEVESEDGTETGLDMDLEIFPDGDELALAFKDDLWPDAIKYFSEFYH